MKNSLKSTILIAVLTIVFTSCGPKPEEAAKYNDEIVKEQIEIVKKISALQSSYTDFKCFKMRQALNEAIDQTKASIEKIKNLQQFDGSTNYKDGAVNLFETYLNVLKNQHTTMVEIYCLPNEDFNELKKEEWNNNSKEANKKITDALEVYTKMQQEFAKNYGLSLKTINE